MFMKIHVCSAIVDLLTQPHGERIPPVPPHLMTEDSPRRIFEGEVEQPPNLSQEDL